ncbi:MAG: acyl-ACP--UDP-N-acetylglucosamine O-acyltransferase [Isosphaeraceae bacterium]|nr:acyl-ACP--UDP-N-acetylglucosamine O-acyltransferase [Isosphaeraceae bacterium]
MATALSSLIHRTAEIGPEVELGPDVQIGPYAILEGPVQVGAGCIIEGYACLSGPLTVGERNVVHQRAVLGKCPQSRGYRGEPTRLVIGDDNVFGEYVTIHRGTADGGGETRLGDRNLLMRGAHLGHDVWVGDDCTFGDYALIAGHVRLMDGCQLAPHTVIQQRVRVGRLARLVGLGGSTKDVPPFMIQQGYNCIVGLNLTGLRQAGVRHEAIDALRTAYRILYKEGRPQGPALDRIMADLGSVPEVLELVNFIRESSLGVSPARGTERQRWVA